MLILTSGVIILYFTRLLLFGLTFLIHKNVLSPIYSKPTHSEFEQNLIDTTNIIFKLLGVIDDLFPILVGFFVGRILKKKSWLYGATIAYLYFLSALIILVVIMLIAPESLSKSPRFFPLIGRTTFAQSQIVLLLLQLPKMMVFAAIGAWFGEKSYEVSNKNKSKII